MVRAVWVLHCANDVQVDRLSAFLSIESQQAAKNMPQVAEMLCNLEGRAQLANLMVALREFKGSSWMPLNSFVHSGIHAVHWTRFEPPQALVDQMFRISNGLAVLACQHLATLSGRPEVQNEVIAALDSCSSSGAVRLSELQTLSGLKNECSHVGTLVPGAISTTLDGLIRARMCSHSMVSSRILASDSTSSEAS